MMTSKSNMAIVIILMVSIFGNLVSSKPTGDVSPQHKENEKVSKIRQKLQYLHDILKDYEEKGISLEDLAKQQHQQQQQQHQQQQQQHQQQQKQHHSDIVETPKTQPKDSTAVNKDTEETKERPRSLSAEDMTRQPMDEDVDEAELEHLGSIKTKRRQDDNIQILAKALRDINIGHAERRAQTTGMKTGRKQKASRYDEATNDDDGNDDVQTDNNDDNNNNDDVGSDVVHGGKELEATLMDALAKMVEEEEENQPKNNQPTLPLFHKTQHNIPNNKMTEHQVPQTGERTQPSGQHLGHQGNNKNNNNNADVKDNDDNDDDDFNDYAILKYLQEAGYNIQDLQTTEQPSRAQVIDELEYRLMEEIQLANQLGVSVNDLIQDLEDKAFREALLRRIQRLLEIK